MSKIKKIIFCLCAICFCGTSIANTETIQWFVDGETYATTNCESGNDITLPNTPTKAGYVFTGWREITNRGTFATWTDIPTNTAIYQANTTGDKTPQEGDFIIVTNAADYPNYEWGTLVTTTKCDCANAQIAITRDGVVTYVTFSQTQNTTLDFDNIISVGRNGSDWVIKNISNHAVLFNKGRKQPNETAAGHIQWGIGPFTIYTTDPNNPLTGTWRFVYKGTWSTNGIGGWKPAERLE